MRVMDLGWDAASCWACRRTGLTYLFRPLWILALRGREEPVEDATSVALSLSGGGGEKDG